MINYELYPGLGFPGIHGASGHSGGSVAGQVEKMLTGLEGLLSKNPDQIFNDILPGLASMANLHPLFVHYPIALLTTFFMLDLFGTLLRNEAMRRTASWLLYFGTLSALATVLMGLQAAATVPHGAGVHAIMEQHKLYGLMVAALAVLLTLWRILVNGLITGLANVFHLLLAALTCLFLVLGADLGGMMVYGYGVGVGTVPPPPASYQHIHTP